VPLLQKSVHSNIIGAAWAQRYLFPREVPGVGWQVRESDLPAIKALCA
jgi:hypothetical protein